MGRLPELTKEAEIRVRLRNERETSGYPVNWSLDTTLCFLKALATLGYVWKRRKQTAGLGQRIS